jgi:type IV pilus assembly protein PilO
MAPFSSITDRFSQWPLYQKIILALGGLLVLGALLGYYFLTPLWKESKALQEGIDREKVKLAQIIQIRAQIIQFRQELTAIDNRYQQIMIMLPEAKEIPHLLKNISSMGLQQGLEFLLFKPEKENPKEFVAEIPITLHLKGSYHQIGIFFDHIRRLSRIVNIKQLELGGFEEKNGKINARCQLVTYRVLPLPPPSSSPKPKGEKK